MSVMPENTDWKEEQPGDAAPGGGTPIVEELRDSTRFRKDRGCDHAHIWFPAELERTVEVHDESLSGLGLYIADTRGFHIGREVGIVYADGFYRGVVRLLTPDKSGRMVVGFQCIRMI